MLQSRRIIITAVALCIGITAFFSSCKKDFSEDTPFPFESSESLYIGSQNGFLYALTPDKGIKKWEYFIGSNIQGTPILEGDMLFVPAEGGTLFQLDATNGMLVKRIEIGSAILGSPYIKNGLLYVGAADGKMRCYSLNDLTLKWDFQATDNIISGATVTVGEPNNGDILVFGCQDGVLRALDADSGALIWRYDPGTGGKFYSSPVIVDDVCYVGNSDGNLYAVHTRTNTAGGITKGTLKYFYPTGGEVLSSPIVYGGNVIFGSSDAKLYCLDVISGSPRWIRTTGDRITSSPIAYKQVVYVGSYDFFLYAYDIIDGSLHWKFRTDALIKSSPIAYKDRVYVASYDKKLYAVDTSAGKPIWNYNVNGIIETSPVIDTRSANTIYPAISGAGNQ